MEGVLEELRSLMQERSIRLGEFTLASGDKSNYYCDSKATTLSPRGSMLVGQLLYDFVSERGAEVVGGLALGATFLATAVAIISEQNNDPIYAFTVRDQRKGHGLKKAVEESFHPDGDRLLRPGRRVAIVDDVVTKGGSVLKAVEEVRQRGCEIVAVVSLVDRNAGGGEKLRNQGLPYFAFFSTNDNGVLRVNQLPGRSSASQLAAAGTA